MFQEFKKTKIPLENYMTVYFNLKSRLKKTVNSDPRCSKNILSARKEVDENISKG